MKFFNSTQKNFGFPEVVENIKKFIAASPEQKYRLAVGTDSQVNGKQTCFATGIHIHRIGQGAWCCILKKIENKRYDSLNEKISKETIITYEIMSMLNAQLIDTLCEYAVQHNTFDCRLEAHIDIGTKGETRKLIREMVGYFEGLGVDAKIKPDSFVASSYADRFSKNNKRAYR
ncbi:MAG: hypothetical protein GX144_12885 [Clostridiaceae bacterium]|jgi:predicted RNase H-related nuclease YkuK (DUF458 family)|nr:hypothetical protein [Clostridiaceae bacterium]